MAKKKKDLKEILFDIYRDLYANSEPKADFDELVNNAEVDSEGRKIIPYNDYEIDDELMDRIVETHLRANRLSSIDRGRLKISVYLGCGPRTKFKEENKNNE